MNVAVITARGGSKRIPRKNIKEFCGRPILAYSVDAALQSGVFDEVMVSTEDEEIAAIARALGAAVPFMRSAAAADDHATTADVLCEVAQRYRDSGRNFEYLCCVYPTAPFVTAQKLRDALALLQSSDADSLLPVVRFSFPPQRAVAVRGGLVEAVYPQYLSARSQDLEPQYHDCGQFYFVRTDKLLSERSVLAGRTVPLELPETEVQDIDTMDDWDIAEIKYRCMLKTTEE